MNFWKGGMCKLQQTFFGIWWWSASRNHYGIFITAG